MGKKSLLGVLCVLAGAIALSYGLISDDLARFSYTLIIAVAYLTLTLVARRKSSLRSFWELSFAFFILAFVSLLNNLSHYFGAYVLNAPPVPGNPLASTVVGSVIVQLVETLVAIIPIVVLTKASGMKLGSIYARKGRLRGWFLVAVVAFVFLYILTATRHSSFIPTKGPVTLSNFLALTPALLVMVISNGFQEEFLFRGLFLQRYNTFFSGPVSILLSAIVFGIAHLGVTYTPSAIIFILIAVFPLGLITGYLMRSTNGVVTPVILHAGFDIPIYWAFLSYVT